MYVSIYVYMETAANNRECTLEAHQEVSMTDEVCAR